MGANDTEMATAACVCVVPVRLTDSTAQTPTFGGRSL
jgi:hypothetical protein